MAEVEGFKIKFPIDLDPSELEKGLTEALSKAEKEVIDRFAKQTAAINKEAQKQVDIIRQTEKEKTAEIKHNLDKQIADIKATPDLDGAARKEKIRAAREDAALQTKLVKDGAKLRETAVKNEADKQKKTYNDLAKNQIKAFQDANKKSLQAIKDFAKGAVSELLGIDQVLAAIAGGPVAMGKAFVGAGKQIISTLNQWGQAAIESMSIQDTLGAVIKSTGASAWTTASQLNKLAADQSAATGKSKDEITQMQSVLLGFRSVTKDVFGDATSAAIDMSKVMGGDLRGAANMLGKALDTPVQGMGALSRVGFVFSDQQKEMVKRLEEAGNHLEAQKIILGEVQAAFSGAAAVVNPAIQAQIQYNSAVENFKKIIGTGWAESMAPVLQAIAKIINWYSEGIEGIRRLRSAQLEYNRSRGIVDAIDEEIAALERYLATTKNTMIYKKLWNELMQANKDRNAELAEQINEQIQLLTGEKKANIEALEEKKKGTLEYITVLQNELNLLEILQSMAEGGKAGVDFSRREAAIAKKYYEDLFGKFKANEQAKLNIAEHYSSLRGAVAEAEAKQEEKRREEERKKAEQDRIAGLMTEEQKRQANQETLEKEIKMIEEKAKIEKKNINSSEIQKQILNARVNAYTELIKQIGSAGEEEKRTLRELQSEYTRIAQLETEELIRKNKENLERQKRDIKEKYELESKSTASLEYQKEILDAEVTAYNNQLKILNDLLDGVAAEDTARKLTLQTQKDQLMTEAQKANAQRKNIDEMLKKQGELNGKVKQMYESAIISIDKAGYETELNKLIYMAKAVEGKARKERLEEEIKINQKIADVKIEFAERQAKKDRETALAELDKLIEEQEQKLTASYGTGDKKAEEAARNERQRLIETKGAIEDAYNLQRAKDVRDVYSEMINAVSGPGAKEKIEALANAQIEALREIEEAEKQNAMERWAYDIGGADNYMNITNKYAAMEKQIEKEKTEAIKQMHLKMWGDILSETQKYLNAAGSIANDISTIWHNNIDYQLNEDLKANDAKIQSDEERAAEEKRLMTEAAQQKYEADLYTWSANSTMAALQASMAVLNALSQPPGPPATIPMSVLAGIMGAAQVAAILSARPKPPRFHSGGVVQGRSGQEVNALLQAPEVVTTQRQFENIMKSFAAVANMRGGGGQPQMKVDIHNNAANMVTASTSFDTDGFKVYIEKTAGDAIANGRLDNALVMQQGHAAGGVFT